VRDFLRQRIGKPPGDFLRKDYILRQNCIK